MARAQGDAISDFFTQAEHDLRAINNYFADKGVVYNLAPWDGGNIGFNALTSGNLQSDGNYVATLLIPNAPAWTPRRVERTSPNFYFDNGFDGSIIINVIMPQDKSTLVFTGYPIIEAWCDIANGYAIYNLAPPWYYHYNLGALRFSHRILWNFIGEGTVHIENMVFVGAILAPDVDFVATAGGSVKGEFVARSLTHRGGGFEQHTTSERQQRPDVTPPFTIPEGEGPGGETPGGETPGGETPGEETPGGETPGGETPGEENVTPPTEETEVPETPETPETPLTEPEEPTVDETEEPQTPTYPEEPELPEEPTEPIIPEVTIPEVNGQFDGLYIEDLLDLGYLPWHFPPGSRNPFHSAPFRGDLTLEQLMALGIGPEDFGSNPFNPFLRAAPRRDNTNPSNPQTGDFISILPMAMSFVGMVLSGIILVKTARRCKLRQGC